VRRIQAVVIDRSAAAAEALLGALRQGGFAVVGRLADTPTAFAEALRGQAWDVVLATQHVPGFGVPRALTILRAVRPDVPLIGIVPARRDAESVALLALGARDVVDPANRDHLLAVVRREVAALDDRRRLHRLERLHGLDEHPATGRAGATAAGVHPPDAVPDEGPCPCRVDARLPDSARDYLTGLPNRGFFLAELTRFLGRPARSAATGHLLLVELEGFRALRQNAGIAACDVIVAELAEVGRRELPAGDLLARFGDNAFAVLSPCPDPGAVDGFAERLRRAIGAAVVGVGGHSFATTCSIGVAGLAAGLTDLGVALNRADQACRRAILAGGNRVRRYEPTAAEGRSGLVRTLASDVLRSALAEDRLSLLFQPVIPVHGAPRAFYQVHLRMLDRQGSSFPFDPLDDVEDPTLAQELDGWVVAHALETALVQRLAGLEPLLMVRLTDRAVVDESVPLQVSRLLRQHRLDGEQFVFEVREEVARGQSRFARAYVSALGRLGCGTAVTDDGAALSASSPGLMQKIETPYVKLGERHVRGLAESERRREALRTFLGEARRLDRVTVASGIAEPQGLAALWQCGVDYAEGDYIQEPGPELSYDFVGAFG
jgi:diguanylate cyclase (GGDEF)-like protein